MPIYQRNNKGWSYAINLKGKVYRGSCKTEDKAQAIEFHDRLRAELWRGRVIKDVQKRTIHDAIDKFLREHQHKRSLKDDERYGQWWKDQFKSAQVALLEEVTPDLVGALRDKEVSRVSVATVNRKIAFLRSVVRAASLEWLWLDKAPKFRLLAGEVERRRFLEPHEIGRLVGQLPAPFSDMALLAVSTGLRQGNVFGLKWSEVDLPRRRLVFSGMVMKNGMAFSIPLNDTATEAIRGWLGRHETHVFVRNGRPVTELPSRLWAASVKQAGLENLRWHDLRHTWASLMRQAGVGLSDLQELGGWESSVMVQRYAHLNVEHLAPKAAVLDGVLKKKPLHKICTAAS